MTGSFSVSALVLRRAPWRDYDRMVTLLTAERGRLDAVVRGCRRPKSPLLSAGEPFVCGTFQIFEARERMSVTEVKVTDGFYPLREDMERLETGAQWLKLLEGVSVPEEPAKPLFDLALEALSFLSYTDLDRELLDTMFILKLMRIVGVSPAADRCAVCGRPLEGQALGFDARKGGCVCRACAPNARAISEGARRIMLKAPRAPFKSVALLKDHPDWRQAREKALEALSEAGIG